MYNKKAAIGATMTWIVATIIILFVIILFVYGAGVFAKESWSAGLSSEYKATDVSKEQMLLALLETEVEGGIDGAKVKNYLLLDKKDYEKLLEKEIKPIIEEFPELLPLEGGWVFIVYDKNGKEEFKIGNKANIRDISPSIVYLSDKKIELSYEKV